MIAGCQLSTMGRPPPLPVEQGNVHTPYSFLPAPGCKEYVALEDLLEAQRWANFAVAA